MILNPSAAGVAYARLDRTHGFLTNRDRAGKNALPAALCLRDQNRGQNVDAVITPL